MRVAVLSRRALVRARGLADLGRRGARRAGRARATTCSTSQLARDGTWSCDGAELALRAGGGLLDADVVFPVLHGPFGEDGTVQGLLELLDVAYVGSGVLASAACMDKLAFKDLMAANGVAAGRLRRGLRGRASSRTSRASGFPCWVKPARLGSSVGIVRVASAGGAAPTRWRPRSRTTRG